MYFVDKEWLTQDTTVWVLIFVGSNFCGSRGIFHKKLLRKITTHTVSHFYGSNTIKTCGVTIWKLNAQNIFTTE